MTTRTGLGRDRAERVVNVVLLTVLAGCAGLAPTAKAAERDEVLLVVQDAPADGVVLASVDLTAAVRWCQVGPIDPARMQAVTAEGRSVPLQFVPAPDYDPKDRVAGTVVFRLPKTAGGPLRLVFGRREQVRGPNDGNDKQATVTTPAWDGMVVTPEFAIQHDAERMGGLPAKIVFRKTGKVFSEFAWNDRVFHRQLVSGPQRPSAEVGTHLDRTARRSRSGSRQVPARRKAPEFATRGHLRLVLFPGSAAGVCHGEGVAAGAV